MQLSKLLTEAGTMEVHGWVLDASEAQLLRCRSLQGTASLSRPSLCGVAIAQAEADTGTLSCLSRLRCARKMSVNAVRRQAEIAGVPDVHQLDLDV